MSTAFIVDDHPVTRLAIRFLLEKDGYTVIGESDNGVDAMQFTRDSPPDLIILDISMPRLDGLGVLARFQTLKTLNIGPKILIFTAQTPSLFTFRCMQSGAAGYVCKEESLGELRSAIKAVMSGYNYFPSEALEPPNLDVCGRNEIERFKSVNDRELMVLQLFAQGRSNKEIAKGMFLSNKTVSTYKKRLMQKLQVASLVELIEIAKRNALV